MQTVSAGYRDASEAAEQQPVTKLGVDWHRTGVYTDVPVSGVDVERTITSDLPGEVTLISGTATATVNITLTGDPNDPDSDLGTLYSPYRTDSPLATVETEGAPAILQLGLQVDDAPELLTQLVGEVRDLLLVATSDGTSATGQLVDSRVFLRDNPQLEVIVGDDPVVPLSGLPQRPGLDVHFVADVVARHVGYYASPPARADSLASATLHGSAWPEVGSLVTASYWDGVDVATAARVRYAPARFALGTDDQHLALSGTPQNYAQWAFIDQPTLANGQTLYHEGWYYLTFGHNDVLMSVFDGAVIERVVLRTDGLGHIGVELLRNGVGVPVDAYPATGRITGNRWYYIGLHITWGTTATVRIRVDGDTDTVSPVVGATVNGDLETAAVYKTGAEAVQWTTEAFAASMWNDGYQPNAVIEPGLSELTVVPSIDAKATAWSILQDIAHAHAGVVMLDETGVLQIWNRRHFGTAPASTTTQRVLRASMPVTGIAVQRLADRVRNVVQVGVTPYQVTDVGIVWALTDASVPIGPRSTFTQLVDLSPSQAYQISTDTHVYPSGGPLVDGRSGYRAARHQTGGAGAITNLRMTVTPMASSIRIEVYNPNPYPVFLVSPITTPPTYPSTSDGKPAMVLVGRKITAVGSEPDTSDTPAAATVMVEYRDNYSISQRGELALSPLEASVWRQNADDALTLAQEIGFEVSQPRPQWPPITILADPSLKLGDRVWLIDDSGQTGIDDPAWIVGSNIRSGGPSGALQDLLLRPIAPPGALILDDPDRGTLDGRWRWA